jgi:phosphopantothenoylcysteine decarboxylase/phosphopantothenate--cysteine ligase
VHGRRVLVGVTGGVAAYKAVYLTRLLTSAGADVTVVMTGSATRFVGPATFSALTGNPVHTSLWERREGVLHVSLAHETDVIVVAPATANVIAKLAVGLADDLLTSTILEYTGPLVIAPAMHAGMWEHPATQGNIVTLASRGAHIVAPDEGALAHGDEGMGRLAEPDDIIAGIEAAIGDAQLDLAGRIVVVSAGPTHEPIDPVRFIGNHSSGTMGMAVATEAVSRGADVRLILGPATVPPPPGVEVTRVITAEQMRQAVMREAPGADAIVMVAAVADFRPKVAAEGKLKKDSGMPELILEPTPDILSELGASRIDGQVLVGFAAETHDVEAAGRAKLKGKHLDLLVANQVGQEGTGFGAQVNHAAILSADGRDTPMKDWTKTALATELCDRIVTLLAPR